jgi:hypothetical protein
VACAVTSVANAASVTWQDVQLPADSTDVATNGATILATYWSGVPSSLLINGVTFTDSGIGTQSQNGVTATMGGAWWTWLKSAFFYGIPETVGAGPNGANYGAMLGYGAWGGQPSSTATVTLSGLTVGHQYLVQFWVFDNTGTNSHYTETISGSRSDTNVPTLTRKSCNAGNFVIGTFTANASTQAFALTDTDGKYGPQLNGFQLRDVTGVTVVSSLPSPPVSALGTGGTVAEGFSYQIPLYCKATNYGATGLPPGLSLDAGTGWISGRPSDPGIYYSTVSETSAGVTYPATMIFVMTPAQGTPALSSSVPRGYLNNVPESTNYTLVYSLNIPWTCHYNTSPPPYAVDTDASVAPFTRVAYYLELQAPNGTLQYVWASMNAFTANAGQIGVPTAASGASFQQAVTGLNVVSDVPGVVTGTGLSGSLNFSPLNYGSMAVSNPAAGQTIFGFANWGGNGGYANVGIGANSLAATNYSVRSLQVLVLNSATSITIQPVADNSLLINPGKGYAEYWNGPSQYTGTVTAVGYSRCDWSTVEPSEGVYNWSWVDNNIAAYARYGRPFAFGVMNVDSGEDDEYATPRWVFQPGTNLQTGSIYANGAVPAEIPDSTCPSGYIVVPSSWDDPVFLPRMHEFIAAFGARYNGNTNIAYLDTRDYGDWGEGEGLRGLSLPSPGDLLTNYYMPYMQVFPNTQQLEDGLYGSVDAWRVTHGAGARTDGICSGPDLSNGNLNGYMDLLAYPYHPAAMEYWGMPTNVYRGGPENELMIYVAGGRPSYLQFNGDGLYPTLTNFYNMVGNVIGYHFVLQQASVPKTVQAGVPFSFNWTWFNDGVAPLYEPCSVAVALLDANSNVVQKQWLPTSNPQGWRSGVSTTESFTNVIFSSVQSGKLAVGLFLNQTDVNPAYRLGVYGRTASGWYILSSVSENFLPAVPANLVVTAGNAQVAASWNAVSGATGYNLKSSTTNGGPYAVVAANLNGLAYTNSGLANGTMYYFVVSATNSAGESANSTPAGARPVSPVATNITAAVSGNVLQLSWPVDHTGWRLLVQTNHLAAGVSSNTNDWATVPGSAGINQTSITINPADPTEFYRLVYP